jgi:hypothetical protein
MRPISRFVNSVGAWMPDKALNASGRSDISVPCIFQRRNLQSRTPRLDCQKRLYILPLAKQPPPATKQIQHRSGG